MGSTAFLTLGFLAIEIPIGIPTIIGLSFAWVGHRIISNEKELKNREIELKLQLDAKSNKKFV